MRTPRIAVVGVVAVVVLLAASYTASAQPRTNPPTLDFTCYGYDNGPQRAYNCIPERSQQSLMRTFVPAVGSRCDDGKIITTSDQPDRIVFQIRCDDTGGSGPTTPTGPTADYEVFNVRRYPTSIRVADWLEFSWRANVTALRFEVSVTFQQGAYHTVCTEYFYKPVAGLQEDELSIPDVCGVDQQWSSVTIAAADGRVCAGCGTFNRTALPNTRSLVPGAADPNEVNTFIEEVTYRTQMGATRAR